MNWEYWVILICSTISLFCKLGTWYIEEQNKKINQIAVNRQQRRHPNGRVPAQKFKRVNVPKQKQGNNRAIKNW